MITVPHSPGALDPEEAVTGEAKTTAAAPVIAIPPPPPALRTSVARLIVEILARRALADLGAIVHNDNHEPPR